MWIATKKIKRELRGYEHAVRVWNKPWYINGFNLDFAHIKCRVSNGFVLNQIIEFYKVHHFIDDTNLLLLHNWLTIKKLITCQT